MRDLPNNRPRQLALGGWLTAGLVGACGCAGDLLTAPPFEVAPPVEARRHERNWYSSVAFNSGRWLVAWSNSTIGAGESARVRAAVVDSAGARLTPFAVDLVPEQDFPWRMEEVDVAPLGDGFLVVWTRINTFDESYVAFVEGVKVDRDGVAHGPPEILSLAGSLARFPQLAAAGDRCLLAWTDDIQHDGTIELRGRIIHATGSLTSEAVRDLSPPDLAQNAVSIASSGDRFLAVWTALHPPAGIYGVHGTIINADGEAGPAFPVAANGHETYAEVAPLGDGFLVTWHDFWRDFGPGVGEFGDLEATRVTREGELLDDPELVVRANPDNDSIVFSEIAGTAEAALILWTNTTETGGGVLETRRILPDGTITTPPGGPPGTENHQLYDAVVTPGGSGWLLAHARDADQPVHGSWPSELFVRRLAADGSIDGPEIPVSASFNRTRAVSVAAVGGEFVAVWQDDRNAATDGWDIWARRFTTDGFTSEPTLVAGGPGDQVSPVAAGHATGWAVAWTDQIEVESPGFEPLEITTVWGRTVEGGPVVPATQLSASGVNARGASIAYGAGKYFVVWRQEGGLASDIFGAALESPAPAPIPVCVDPTDQRAPAVAGSDSGFLVVWRDARGPMNAARIFSSFLPGGSAAVIADGVPLPMIEGGDQVAPEVANHGDRFLVAWRQRLPMGDEFPDAIAAVRLAGDGQIIDSAPVFVASPSFRPSGEAASIREPAVAGDGDGWVVAWHYESESRCARVHDEAALRIDPAFRIIPPLVRDRETLSLTMSGGVGVAGFVTSDPDRAHGVIFCPDETVPTLEVSPVEGGRFRLTLDAQPHFEVEPDSVEISFDGLGWTPLVASPSVTWLTDRDGSLVLTPPASGLAHGTIAGSIRQFS